MILGLVGTVFAGLVAAMGLGAFGSTYWAYGAGETGAHIWVAGYAATAGVATAVALVGSVLAGWWPGPAALLLTVAALFGLPAGGLLWIFPFLLFVVAAGLAWGAARGDVHAPTPGGRTSFRWSASAFALVGAAAGAAAALLELGWFGPEYSGGTGHRIDPLWHDVLVVGALTLAAAALVPGVLASWRPGLSAALLAAIALAGFPFAAGRIYFWEATDRWHFSSTCLLAAAVFALLGREPRARRDAGDGTASLPPAAGPAPPRLPPPAPGVSPEP